MVISNLDVFFFFFLNDWFCVVGKIGTDVLVTDVEEGVSGGDCKRGEKKCVIYDVSFETVQ